MDSARINNLHIDKLFTDQRRRLDQPKTVLSIVIYSVVQSWQISVTLLQMAAVGKMTVVYTPILLS